MGMLKGISHKIIVSSPGKHNGSPQWILTIAYHLYVNFSTDDE